jgi:hypothetical protein
VIHLRPRRRGICVVVVVSALAFGGCGGKPHQARQSEQLGSGRGAPTLADVGALLDRHGRAVLQRSTRSFLDDVDGAAAVSDFRHRQSAEIAALADVPLQSWTYSVSAPVTDAASTAGAAKLLGAPTLIVHVTLTYALQHLDTIPASHDLWWTFVKRHGHVYLAGDDAMSAVGGASWRGPWDFGPLVVERGTSSLVLGHPGDAARLPALAAAVDAAVPVVTGVWGSGWAQQVVVIVPASEEELSALGGPGVALTDIGAETVFEGANTAVGAASAARVLMNPAQLDRLTAVGRRIVVQHEITHIATAASTGPASPRWLIEGFAEYVGNLGSGQPVPDAAAELRRSIAQGHLPTQLPGEADFSVAAAALPQTYEESWLACRLIAARAGQAGLVRFYRLVGASEDLPAAATAPAMQSVLHESTAAFTAQWRAYLTAQLPPA